MQRPERCTPRQREAVLALASNSGREGARKRGETSRRGYPPPREALAVVAVVREATKRRIDGGGTVQSSRGGAERAGSEERGKERARRLGLKLYRPSKGRGKAGGESWGHGASVAGH